MHLSRETNKTLNESIHNILSPQYLSEEEFDAMHDEFIQILSENYTIEEIEQFTEEELIEGFMETLGAGLGRLKTSIGKGVKDFKAGYERGRYGKPKEEPKPETSATAEEPTEEPTEPRRTKLTPRQIKAIRNSPEAVRKSTTRQIAKSTSSKDPLSMSLVKRLQAKGVISSSGAVDPRAKAAASKEVSRLGTKISSDTEAAKAKAAAAKEKAGDESLRVKRGAAYDKCVKRGGDEKKCMKYASSIMASKEYYSDLRKRLLENYKK
jgi:hypothetical protein